MRILAIGCHPDDLEINCFGTLLRYIAQGHEVVTCTVANGCMGHMVIPPEELKVIRLKEAQAASRLIGAVDHICLDVDDLKVDSHNEAQMNAVVDVIRYAKPDVILSHMSGDYMRDHNETHELVFAAGFMSSIPHYETKQPCHPGVQPLYYFEPDSAGGFRPTDYVDITSVIDRKLEALACHESQIKWLKDHTGEDVLAQTRAMAAFRGKLCGVQYAEGFVRCDHSLRMTVFRHLP